MKSTNSAKQNYKIIISYDGTRYNGWEKHQKNDLTIQGKLESVLTQMQGETVEIIGAGRTDAGVHAKGMVANFTLSEYKNPKEIRDYCNKHLPDDICITEIHEVSERFHSRYNAVGKTYCYTCHTGPLKPVFDKKYVYCINGNPDIQLMKQAAKQLMGTHDFAAFCSNKKMKKSTIRTVDRIDIERRGDYITFTYHGNGFLQHMIRILTGTLLEAGYGKISPDNISSILESKHRPNAGPTAPSCGLCLIEVDYN